MAVKQLTRKQLRGEAEVPDTIIITQLDRLKMGRRSDGYQCPPIPHGTRKYSRRSKHKEIPSE